MQGIENEKYKETIKQAITEVSWLSLSEVEIGECWFHYLNEEGKPTTRMRMEVNFSIPPS